MKRFTTPQRGKASAQCHARAGRRPRPPRRKPPHFLKELSATEEMKPSDAVHQLYAMKSPSMQAAWGRVANENSDSVLLEMLKAYVRPLLAGILAAGIISAVMGSDCHQILGLSTMFTKDIFTYYGGGQADQREDDGVDGPRVHRDCQRSRLFNRAGQAADFRAGDVVRILRIRGTFADDDCRAVLAAQHQVGRHWPTRSGSRHGLASFSSPSSTIIPET